MTEKTTSNAEAIEAIQRSNEEAEKEAELECIRCGKVNRIKSDVDNLKCDGCPQLISVPSSSNELNTWPDFKKLTSAEIAAYNQRRSMWLRQQEQPSQSQNCCLLATIMLWLFITICLIGLAYIATSQQGSLSIELPTLTRATAGSKLTLKSVLEL
jgi:hypothetical protein